MRAYWVSVQGSTMTLQCQDIGLCAREPNSIVYHITMQRLFGTGISGNRRLRIEVLDI